MDYTHVTGNSDQTKEAGCFLILYWLSVELREGVRPGGSEDTEV